MTSPGIGGFARRTPAYVSNTAATPSQPPAPVAAPVDETVLADASPPSPPSDCPAPGDRSSPDSLRARLMTLSEVATVFRRKPRTIREWVKAKKLSVVKIGRAKFVNVDQIERILVNGEAEWLREVSSSYETIEKAVRT